MIPYKSKSGNKNGVISFVIENESIILNYKSRNGGLKSIKYCNDVSGIEHVKNIKEYALLSENLNRYLIKNRIHCKKINNSTIQKQHF